MIVAQISASSRECGIERFAQSGICLILALLIFRLICRFPFYSILLRPDVLQCVILRSQSTITHAQLRTVKPVSVPCLKNPRIYRKTHECEHRQNDADPLPTIEPCSHCRAENSQLRFNANRFSETASSILSLSHCLGYTVLGHSGNAAYIGDGKPNR